MKYFYQAALPRLFPSYKWIIILLQMGNPALLLNNCSKLTVQKLALNQHKKKSNERLCTEGHFRSFFNDCRFDYDSSSICLFTYVVSVSKYSSRCITIDSP